MKLSVVVISRNEGPWLRRTIDGLIATLPPDCEIVVVDDGSEDASADSLNCDRLRLIRSLGLGVARARNLGALESTGDVIVFADAHLCFQPCWWQALAERALRLGAGGVAPAVGDIDHPDRFGYGFTLDAPDLVPQWFQRYEDVPFQAPIVPGCCLAMSRAVFSRTGGFDPGLKSRGGIDAETGVRFWLQGFENWVVPESKVWHLFRAAAPFPVRRPEVIHNRLRLAYLHFSPQRIETVRHALAEDPAFEQAERLAAGSDWPMRQKQLLATRVHDDRWFFQKFGISW